MRIVNIKSKKLLLAKRGDMSGLNPGHIVPLCNALFALRMAKCARDLPLSLRPHFLDGRNGKRSSVTQGLYVALKVSAQWRLIFRITGDGIHDLDYVQYH